MLIAPQSLLASGARVRIEPVRREHISLISLTAAPAPVSLEILFAALALHSAEAFNLDIRREPDLLTVRVEARLVAGTSRRLVRELIGQSAIRSAKIEALPIDAPGMNAKTGAPHRKAQDDVPMRAVANKLG